jgi:hypothetical protein
VGNETARNRKREKMLTLDFERTPLEPSIHTYSAVILPFCGSWRYLASWGETISKHAGGRQMDELTLAVLETIVDSAMAAVCAIVEVGEEVSKVSKVSKV